MVHREVVGGEEHEPHLGDRMAAATKEPTSRWRAQSLRTSSSSQRAWMPLKIRGNQAMSR